MTSTGSQLTVVRPGIPIPPPSRSGETVVGFDEFARLASGGKILAQVRRFGESRMLVHRLESVGRPLLLSLALRWVTRGNVYVEDARGRRRRIDGGTLARWIAQVATEPFAKSALLRRTIRDVDALEHDVATRQHATLDLSKPPLYLRSDLSFGIRAGGSVGHIAGVVNELEHFTPRPIFVTTDEVPTVRPDIEQHLVTPSEAFWNFQELPAFVLNETLETETTRLLAGRTPSFIYQRYSLDNYTGIRLARRLRVPLVLEYNGSEVWVARHWGRPLKFDALAQRIEQLNLRAADLLVVVSRAVRDEAVGRGADPDRVLVNTNGVNPDRYRPDIDGSGIRAKYGLDGAVVIGFIGTFGLWHGAEILARAYVRFRAWHPALAERARLMLIGDGVTMPATRQILAEGGAIDATVFTGLTPQEDGPRYLAACDVLASPHVPNPDGTPFFGSPTKLFEYMAMGKAIVASKLDQIGEVLEDGKTALMVPPGDVDALSNAIAKLATDRALRECLGTEARRAAVERHTWREHTRRTIEALTGSVRLQADRR